MTSTTRESIDEIAAPEAESKEYSKKRKNAITASYQGLFLDFVDVYLPVIALAPAMIYFTSPEMTPLQMSAIFYLTFAATLIGRPLGSIIFGTISDRFGRRKVTLISVGGFTVCTLAIGLLPGFESIGMAAPVLLMLLRFIDGIFLGGEYTAATPMAFEYEKKERRGLLGGILQTTYPAAYVAISLLTLFIFTFAPAGDLNSPYVQWGWRIGFILSAVLSTAFFIYRWNNLPESEAWEKSKKAKDPVRTVLFGKYRKDFWQVFILMSGMWLLVAATTSVIPNMLLNDYGFSSTTTTWTMLLVHVFLIGMFIFIGATGQRIGRRNIIMLMGGLAGTVGAGAWVLFGAQLFTNPVAVGVLVGVITLIAIGVFGTALTYCNERFATNVRSSGFGMAYSLSIVLPNLYGVYSLFIAQFVPVEQVSTVCYVIAGLLLVVGARMGPDTRDVDLVPKNRLSEAK